MMSTETTEKTIDFEELAGQECDFYGVDGTRFRLDDVTYEYIEHENGSYEITEAKEPMGGLPIARVVVGCSETLFDGFVLTDLHDDHEWLEWGRTLFISEFEASFEYSPKAPEAQ